MALIVKSTNKLPFFWDILFYFNFYIFPSKASFPEEKCRTFAVQSVYASQVCCRVFLCACVLGLRQNRAAEMRQALQIFVGWLTALCWCQAPTAETTKRRIRLALEPQIFSPPPSLLPFSPSLFSLRGTAFTLVGVWLDLATSTSTREFINLSLFHSDLMGGGSRKHGTWNTSGGFRRLFSIFFPLYFGCHLVLCISLTPCLSFLSVAEWAFWEDLTFRVSIFLSISAAFVSRISGNTSTKTSDTIASGVTSMRHWAHVPPKT